MEENIFETYTPEEIMKILKLGRTKTYDLLNESFAMKTNFRVIKLGRQLRVPKLSFQMWFTGRRSEYYDEKSSIL